jgi:hypothetical protein
MSEANDSVANFFIRLYCYLISQHAKIQIIFLLYAKIQTNKSAIFAKIQRNNLAFFAKIQRKNWKWHTQKEVERAKVERINCI